MASGDGLLVRVRPPLSRLTAGQVFGLCDAALTFGCGLIDLTNRANLQLRGVQAGGQAALIEVLCGLGLLDADPARETWPAVLVAPLWQAGDDTAQLATDLSARLSELPALPTKFGFAVDAGPAPVLGEASADVRIERAASGALIVRADGAAAGHPVTGATAVDVALAMATWFADTAGVTSAPGEPASRRMKAHLTRHTLPPHLAPSEPAAAPAALPPPGLSSPGPSPLGPVYGAAFGQMRADALARLLRDSGATALRLTPQRTLILEGGRWGVGLGVSHGTAPTPSPNDPRPDRPPAWHGFLTTADDPLRHIDACPGAPACASATVATRDVARAIADTLAGVAGCSAAGPGTPRSLHVSGCAKGCARARAADITLVGRDGVFDLVRGGCAWDTPARTGLSPQDLPTEFPGAFF